MAAARIFLASLALLAVLVDDAAVEGLVCNTNTDCARIQRGATRVCVGGVCTCSNNYIISAAGCDLRISAPTLRSNFVESMAEGGDYTFTCVPTASMTSQNSITYRLIKDGQEVMTLLNNHTFYLTGVDDDDAGTYRCDHTFDEQRGPMSNEMVVRVVDAGWVCYTNQGCPSEKGYRKSCDTDKNRCECEDDYKRKGTHCVYDGASSTMAASVVMVVLTLVVSRLF